ncbi:MAG: DUF5916 domain-containing protein, partial [Bacteroidota bacterium]
FGVFIDPYYDRRSGFFFALSAAGTMVDGTLYNDDWDDTSWDGVWEGEVRIDDRGWTAEIRVPFSQLRFHQQDTYTWGINFRRDIGRRGERNYVVYTPRNESGFVSRFVDLAGITGVFPVRQVEILPYVNTRAEYVRRAANDPFHNGSRYFPGVGADMKVGLAPNLTLDITVNPDFGQVEVDPAVVNLSDVETFFQEKRPFFIEGANTFGFGFGGSNSYWSFNYPNPTLFYSRRIGRSPQGSLPDHDYADLPLGTHILGAGKISGKVGDNVNIGMIHALTRREFAHIQSLGNRSSVETEPLTYYGISRAQKEFNNGQHAVGFLGTYTKRMFDDTRLESQINREAWVGGLDGWTFLDDDRTYVITGWVAGSHIQGTRERMIALQRNSVHYFQRPDASHVRVDSAATSITGWAGRFLLNKQKGSVLLNAGLAFIDPYFDVNDLGFLSRTDAINSHIMTGYRWTEPTSLYRQISLRVATFANYDFEGNKTWHGYFHNAFLELPNFYGVYWGLAYNPHTFSNRKTRGGPLMLTLPGREMFLGIDSDSRKEVVVSVFGNTYRRNSDDVNYYAELSVEW